MLHFIHSVVPVLISAYDSGYFFGTSQMLAEFAAMILEPIAKGK